MRSTASTASFLAAALLIGCCCASSVPAQIPEGWGVACALRRVDDALQAFSPRTRAQAIPLTNVPDEVRLVIGVSNGANSVAILPDGRVAVGNSAGLDGRPVVVHVLSLDGFGVVATERFLIGTSFSSGGTVSALQALDDGRVVYTTQSIYPGPSNVGVLDLVAGTVSSLGISGLPSRDVNAVAVSDDQRELFLGLWFSPSSGAVYRAPLSGGRAQLVATTPHGVTGLDVDNDGNVLVAMNNAGAGLGVVDPLAGTFTATAGTPRNCNAVACERTSGSAAYAHSAFPSAPTEISLLVPGAASPSTIADVAGGRTAGLDFRESPRVYGAASPAVAAIRWRTRPNHGGLPLLGNLGFSLTFDVPAGAQLGLLLVAASRASISFQGVEVLVDPPGAVLTPISLGGATAAVPLPIPDDAQLIGLRLHAQALFAGSGGALSTSPGLTFGPVQP